MASGPRGTMGPGFVPFWLGLAIAVLGIAIAHQDHPPSLRRRTISHTPHYCGFRRNRRLGGSRAIIGFPAGQLRPHDNIVHGRGSSPPFGSCLDGGHPIRRRLSSVRQGSGHQLAGD